MFVETRYPDTRVTIIKASTSNDLSDQPSRFPHLRDIYWHKLYAQHLNLEASIRNLRCHLDLRTSIMSLCDIDPFLRICQDIFDLGVPEGLLIGSIVPPRRQRCQVFLSGDFSCEKFTDGFVISFMVMTIHCVAVELVTTPHFSVFIQIQCCSITRSGSR